MYSSTGLGTVLKEAMPAGMKVEYCTGKDHKGQLAAVKVYPLN